MRGSVLCKYLLQYLIFQSVFYLGIEEEKVERKNRKIIF